MFYLKHFGLTDPGKVRENNEDSLLVGEGADETLFAIADGVGGFEAGEVASRMAIDALKNMTPDDSFDDVVREANRRIRAASKGDERLGGMGTTIVAIRFGGTRQRPVAEVAHVGDSRAYLVRGGKMRPITEDHSLVAELVRSGDLTRDEAAEHPQKNLITRALGVEDTVKVDTTIMPIEARDRILLCSDGLSDMVNEKRIEEVLLEHPDALEDPAETLLSGALDAGGGDNITIVLVDVRQHEERKEPPRGGTQEMRAVGASAPGVFSPTSGERSSRSSTKSRNRSGRKSRGTQGRRRRPLYQRILTGLVRGVAVLAVLCIAVVPAYLWGSSRYFLDSTQSGEVVVYQGLPWTVAGIPFNQEWRRPGINLDEVNTASRPPIEENTLYTQGDIEEVLAQLERDAEQNRQEAQQNEEEQNQQGDDPARDTPQGGSGDGTN